MSDRTCTMPDCGKPYRAKGLCVTHYNHLNYSDRERRKPVEMTCAQCGLIMVKPKRSDRANQFCSFLCRDAHSWASVRAENQENERRRLAGTVVHVGPASPFCTIPKRHPARATRPKRRVWVTGACVWCGLGYVVVDQLSARYCSARCAKAAGRNRYNDFRISPIERLAIYERDAWVCGICLGAVDQTLEHNDQWAASLDHIECQSWALIPDHSPKNLRLAHRWCNAVRGDETYYTAADLLAG